MVILAILKVYHVQERLVITIFKEKILMTKDVNITVFETEIDCTSLIAMLVKEMLEQNK